MTGERILMAQVVGGSASAACTVSAPFKGSPSKAASWIPFPQSPRHSRTGAKSKGDWGGATQPPCRDTLPTLPSPLWGALRSLTAPDSTIFSGRLAVSSGTSFLRVPRRSPALLSLSGGGRVAGRQPAGVPVPAHSP